LAFNFDFSDELKDKINFLHKKDKKLLKELNKKIKQIVSRDNTTIDLYKNCRKNLKDYKRIHVGSFVLLFIVEKENNFIWFDKFEHHDDAYL